MLASVEYGHGIATSGHLLAALLLDEGLRRTAEGVSAEFKKSRLNPSAPLPARLSAPPVNPNKIYKATPAAAMTAHPTPAPPAKPRPG